jgi:hypothetical protein
MYLPTFRDNPLVPFPRLWNLQIYYHVLKACHRTLSKSSLYISLIGDQYKSPDAGQSTKELVHTVKDMPVIIVDFI